MQIRHSPDHLNKPRALAVGLVLMSLLGLLDYLTGYEISFAVFYLIPISIVAWEVGRTAGLLTALASTATWHMSNLWAGEVFSNPLISYWNTSTRLMFFLVVVVLLARMRHSLEQEKLLSRRDPLTNALNVRAFREALEWELAWTRRHHRPFTLAYIDLDNFKSVNDQSGHGIGDQLLQVVVQTLQKNVRVTDFVARVGGDEFVVLLRETDSQGALCVAEKLQSKLLDSMEHYEWPVTFSVGVLTCYESPDSIDTTMQQADHLMYEVKNNGKNGILISEFSGA